MTANAAPVADTVVVEIVGTTVRVNGRPASNVPVVLEDSRQAEIRRTTSDSLGAFDFGPISVEIGRYQVTAEHPSRARSESLWVTPADQGAVFALNLPPGTIETRGEDLPHSAQPRLQLSCAEVTVWFGTNRGILPDDGRRRSFGTERGTLVVGRCVVSLPRDHRLGRLETPFLRLGILKDSLRHVVVRSVEIADSASFLASLSTAARSSPGHDVLVFVHGYNVDFDDAARRCAQLSYDLKWTGLSAFFSWPSAGQLSGYTADEATWEASVPSLSRFLVLLGQSHDVANIHVVCHSMGARVVLAALERLDHTHPAVMGKVRNLVLTAPDVDVDVYRNVAAALRSRVGRLTLYASSRDRALIASAAFHHSPRAGESGPHLVIVDGVDTIDASDASTADKDFLDFLGHGYFAESRTIVGDLFGLLREGKPPDQRFGLRPQRKNARPYWLVIP